MEKIDNFSNCLGVLKKADFELANDNEIYRMGIIGQFNLTFELAWKALQAVLQLHGIEGSKTGSPRDILRLGYQCDFIKDSITWLTMLKERNNSTHIYDGCGVEKTLLLIRDSFIPAFVTLEETLKEKLRETDSDWDN